MRVGAVSTLADVATACNLTIRRVNQLAREGVLPREARGTYSLGACLVAYIRYLQKAMVGKSTFHADGTITNTAQLRARLLDVRIARQELALARARHETVTIMEFEEVLSDLVVTSKMQLLAVGTRVAPRIAGETSRTVIERAIDAEVKAALSQLATYVPRAPRCGRDPRRDRPASSPSCQAPVVAHTWRERAPHAAVATYPLAQVSRGVCSSRARRFAPLFGALAGTLVLIFKPIEELFVIRSVEAFEPSRIELRAPDESSAPRVRSPLVPVFNISKTIQRVDKWTGHRTLTKRKHLFLSDGLIHPLVLYHANRMRFAIRDFHADELVVGGINDFQLLPHLELGACAICERQQSDGKPSDGGFRVSDVGNLNHELWFFSRELNGFFIEHDTAKYQLRPMARQELVASEIDGLSCQDSLPDTDDRKNGSKYHERSSKPHQPARISSNPLIGSWRR
jgi:hypothetical protein